MIEAVELRVFAPGASKAILAGIIQSWQYAEAVGIRGPLRLPHFMAQIAHESDGFRTTREYASGAAYEGRKDLGNTQPGDGKRYRGRGVMQITGRANYRAFTKWLRARKPDCPDFEASPELLEQFPWAFVAAVWYWETRGLNKLADANNIRGITLRINGGYNGLEDRRAKFRKAVAVWSDGQVNPKGSSFAGTRTVKAVGASLLAGPTLAGVSEQVGQVSAIAGGTRAISDAVGLPLWGLVLGVCLIGGLLYVLWDRRFIYQHEGL